MAILATICCFACCYDERYCAGSDSTGVCNLSQLAGLEGKAADDAQAYMMDRFGDEDFALGDKEGCFWRDFASGGKSFTAYSYFGCDDEAGTKCRDCFAAARDRLKEGCSGRAGGTVFRHDCCLRYEVENIC
ncbi:unnamed protein product [Linum trigynum]